MKSVSFILNGDNIPQSQIDKLGTKLETINKKKNTVAECLLFFSTPPKVTASSAHINLVYAKVVVSSIEKAVASASSKYIIFTTIGNVIAKIDVILIASDTKTTGAVWVEYETAGTIGKILGIRHLVRTPYIIAERRFVASQGIALCNFPKIVRQADRCLALGKLNPTGTRYPDYLIRRMILLRPYGKIVKNKWQLLQEKVHSWHQARKAIKLSKLVAAAPYSPDMPVFIICRDRVAPLKQLVAWCEDEGLTNIILIDNDSSYPPLLDYLATTPHEVIRLNVNAGHTAPWDTGIVDLYAKNRPFIVTDPDILPSSEAHGAVKFFCELLNKYPERRKVGFGLKIDDIPNSYELKEFVIAWEEVFWQTAVEPDVFDAEIDTTFAVYRPGTPYVIGPGLRTGGRFIAQHEPWYIDSNHISEELRYYRDHANQQIATWGTNSTDITETYSKNSLKNMGKRIRR